MHKSDGTLKSGVVQSANLATNAVGANALANNSVTNANLAVSGGFDGNVLTKDSTQASGFAWVATSSTSQSLGGDLSGTTTNATIVSSAITTPKLADGSVRSTKIANGTIPAQFAPIAGSNITLSGTYPTITISAASSVGVTNLTSSSTATSVTVVSDTGTDATIAQATTSAAGVLSSTDKAKLDVIASGATANQTDAYLLNRANHTGTQAIATITNLQSSLDLKLDTANVDADGTLIINSDTKVASQKATKTYVDAQVATKADATAVGAKVLLIDNVSSLPAGTPAGVVVVVKA